MLAPRGASPPAPARRAAAARMPREGPRAQEEV